MDTWFMKDLGDGVLAGIVLDEVEGLIGHAIHDGVEDIAAFTRHVSGELHCSVVLYLSPAASQIANRINAQACTSPGRSGLNLLAGHEEAWELV